MPKPQADRCPTCHRLHPTPAQIAGKSRRQLKYLRKIHELARIGRKVAEGK